MRQSKKFKCGPDNDVKALLSFFLGVLIMLWFCFLKDPYLFRESWGNIYEYRGNSLATCFSVLEGRREEQKNSASVKKYDGS